MSTEQQKIEQLESMGYTKVAALDALARCNGNVEQAVEHLISTPRLTPIADPALESALKLSRDNLKLPPINFPNSTVAGAYETDIQKAIELSMQEKSNGGMEPVNPEQKIRIEGTPSGLVNVGNTWYFNSLIQSYYMIPKLVEEIEGFAPHASYQENQENTIALKSINLVQQVQRLFAFMTRSHRKYQDPSAVLNALVDDLGNQIIFGEQKDVGEFNITLISRIEQGLRTRWPPEATLPLPRSDDVINEGLIISQMFYGRSKQINTAFEVSGEQVVSESSISFGQVILDVDNKDVISAWDAANHTKIEDYKTPLDHVTTAEQEIWVESLPSILLFQLQRVNYDKQSGQGVKTNAKFEFLQLIYADRFLYENRELAKELRQQEQVLKERVRQLESAIELYENYKGTGQSLEVTLNNSIAFLQSQIDSPNMQLEPIEGIQIYTPEAIFPGVPDIAAMLFPTLAQLTSYLAEITRQLMEMRAQVMSLKVQIEALYCTPQFQAHPYNLHSILVHEGQAAGGHYYAYIYEPETQVWRKYNDMMITIVTYDEIMQNAVGGSSTSSAYCLVYVDPSVMVTGPKSMRLYSLQNDIGDMYSEYIPEGLRQEVITDNQKLVEEVEEYKSGGLFKTIVDKYQKRIGKVKDFAQQAQDKRVASTDLKHELINFAVSLELEGSHNLAKWIVLDDIIRSYMISKDGLRSLPVDHPLHSRLRTQFIGKVENVPGSLALSQAEEQSVQESLLNFSVKIHHAALLTFLLSRLNELDYEVATQVLWYFNKNIKDKKGTIYKKNIWDVSKMLVLRLTSMVRQQIYNRDFASAMFMAQLTSVIWAFCIDNRDIHIKQVQSNLTKTFLWAESNLPELATQDLKDIVTKISAQEYVSPIDLQTPPANFLANFQNLISASNGSWVKGWKETGLGRRFSEEFRRMKSVHEPWVRLHTTLQSNRRLIEDEHIAKVEADLGIIPPSN